MCMPVDKLQVSKLHFSFMLLNVNNMNIVNELEGSFVPLFINKHAITI